MISTSVICAALVGVFALLLCNTIHAQEKSVRAAYGEAVPEGLMSHFVELLLIDYGNASHCGGTCRTRAAARVSQNTIRSPGTLLRCPFRRNLATRVGRHRCPLRDRIW